MQKIESLSTVMRLFLIRSFAQIIFQIINIYILNLFKAFLRLVFFNNQALKGIYMFYALNTFIFQILIFKTFYLLWTLSNIIFIFIHKSDDFIDLNVWFNIFGLRSATAREWEKVWKWPIGLGIANFLALLRLKVKIARGYLSF